MPYEPKENFILLAVFCNVLAPANLQIAMPMYMPAAPQPVFAVPAPVPMAVVVQLPERKTTTTTTTTTPEPRYAVAMHVAMPMSVQFAVPAQPPPVFCQAKPRPKSCPPCPPCVCLPSCTPAFFSYCSPCHLKCRCHNPADSLVPLPPSPPIPIPGPMYPVPVLPAPVIPPAVVVVPLPPVIRKPDTPSTDSDTNDSCDSSGDRYYSRSERKSKKGIKRRRHKYRRTARDESDSHTDLVKPVLSYVSENGDVKFITKLSNRDAMEILNEGNIKASNEKQMNIENDDDSVIITKGKGSLSRRYNKVLLRENPINQVLRKGKNEFVFKPSSNKNINSVAVSFQVT